MILGDFLHEFPWVDVFYVMFLQFYEWFLGDYPHEFSMVDVSFILYFWPYLPNY